VSRGYNEAPHGALVPDQDDGAAELLVCGIQQAGVVGLGEALAPTLGGTAVEVNAVDQPGPTAGLGADQRRHRDPFGARGSDLHDRGAASSAPGAALGRPQALTCLVLEAEPGAQVRRPLFMTGHCSTFQEAIFDSSRSVALRVGICALQPMRCSSRSSPARV